MLIVAEIPRSVATNWTATNQESVGNSHNFCHPRLIYIWRQVYYDSQANKIAIYNPEIILYLFSISAASDVCILGKHLTAYFLS